MRSGAEGDVPDRPVDVHAMRVFVGFGIASGQRKRNEHAVARTHAHAVELAILHHPALTAGDRKGAQQFLYGGGEVFSTLAEPGLQGGSWARYQKSQPNVL